MVHVGFLWLGLTLLFEWGGSLAMGVPVEEILIVIHIRGIHVALVAVDLRVRGPHLRHDLAPKPGKKLSAECLTD